MVTIAGSLTGSRQALAGGPGIGKTTLAEAVKADARQAGYWVGPEIISITPEAGSIDLLGQVLAGIYEAVIEARPRASGAAVETAQQLVRSLRLRGGDLSVSAFAVGGGVSRSKGVSQPPSPLLLEGPRALRHLLSYALKEGCRGVVLHLNNLENLSASETQRAADVLRGVQEQALLLEGLHLILVGKTDAVRTAVLRHPQVRSVFAVPLVLSPLGLAEVELLLQKRYEAQQLGKSFPWAAPVEPAVIQALYGLFRGDLRAMLQTLDGGIISLFTAQFTASQGSWELPNIPKEAAAPIDWDTLQAVLRQQKGADLQAELGPSLWGRLEAWAATDAAATQTQNDLQALWGVSEAAVSQALQELQMAGVVEALPRSGTDPIQYLLTGTARLALLPPS